MVIIFTTMTNNLRRRTGDKRCNCKDKYNRLNKCTKMLRSEIVSPYPGYVSEMVTLIHNKKTGVTSINLAYTKSAVVDGLGRRQTKSFAHIAFA